MCDVWIRPRRNALTTSYDPLSAPTPTINEITRLRRLRLPGACLLSPKSPTCNGWVSSWPQNPISPLFHWACALCNKSIQGEILSRLRLSLSFDQEISLCLCAHPLQSLTVYMCVCVCRCVIGASRVPNIIILGTQLFSQMALVGNVLPQICFFRKWSFCPPPPPIQ